MVSLVNTMIINSSVSFWVMDEVVILANQYILLYDAELIYVMLFKIG